MPEVVYMIPGDPESFLMKVLRDRKEYTPARAAYERARIYLTTRHEEVRDSHEPAPYTTPIGLTIGFFFAYPDIGPDKIYLNPTHPTSASLSALYRFVEEVTEGILFSNMRIIVELIIYKQYSDTPRTEITINTDPYGSDKHLVQTIPRPPQTPVEVADPATGTIRRRQR